MLNVKQGSCEYQLLKSFGLTRPGNRVLVYRLRGERSNQWATHYAEWIRLVCCIYTYCFIYPLTSPTGRNRMLFRRSESDAVSLSVLSLVRPSSSYMMTALPGPSPRNQSLTHADDLAIWYSTSDPLKAAHTVQKTLDHLEESSLK